MLPVKQQAVPNLKRKQKVLPPSERISLERVLGLTVSTNASLATDPNTGLIAYPAGCVVVLYNPRRNKQAHIVNTSKKAITCLAFSKDGRHLATGECGHQPAVRVWDLDDRSQVAEFKGHNFSINVVAFSPNQKYLISIGSQHDMMVNVYNWRTQTKVASNKIATRVMGIAFTEDGTMFVTVGNRHVKFWYMDSSKSRIKETVPLKGHSGILGEQKNNFFCGVCCGCGPMGISTYAITRSGLLCEFNEKRLLDKWVELRTPYASCLTAGIHHIFVGCANGIVRIFSSSSLHYLGTMPRPHHLGVDVATGLDPSSVAPAPPDARYPDTVAISLDDEASKLVCVYNDHSLYIWDVHDIKKVGKSRSFLYHSAAIWGLEMYPTLEQGHHALPPGSFVTCSSDDTIRMWNLDPHMPTDTAYRRNVYSNELLKVIYTDAEMKYILEREFNPNKKDKENPAESSGVRSVSISPDGQHLASGDRVGNIRIHDLQFMDQLHMLEAHDSEVLCLKYTHQDSGERVLASAGRDRLLHVFDTQQDYGLIQTLDDHSAAITAVDFVLSDTGQIEMLSCGVDKSLLFRTGHLDPDLQFVLNKHLVSKTTPYDMCVDPKHKFVVCACQDRNIRIYNIKTGKLKKSYSGSLSSDGILQRVDLDRSGLYLATSSSDKTIGVFDFFSGECTASMVGHSEVVTGLKFTNDFKHIISVSGDGCIFLWRVPYDLTEQMQNRLHDLGQGHVSETSSIESGHLNGEKGLLEGLHNTPDKNANLPDPLTTPKPDYRFSVGQLPSWAKRQVLQDLPDVKMGNSTSGTTAAAPRGRWAARADNQIIMKSIMDDNALDNIDNHRLTFDKTDFAKPMVEKIIVDDTCEDDDDEDDEFKIFSKDLLLHENYEEDVNSTFEAGKVTYRGVSQEDEDDDTATDKDVVVFFPPKAEEDTDDAETVASSYRVFAGETISVAESEGTEPLSLDSDDDEMGKSAMADSSSSPGTPDGPGHFMKQPFTLDLSGEEFGKNIEDIPPVPPELSNRLSISARFHTQAQKLRLNRNNSGKGPVNNLQKKREEMAQAVMETRKRLQALGWKVGGSWNSSTPSDEAVPERDIPPSSGSHDQNENDKPVRRNSSSKVSRTPSLDRIHATAAASPTHTFTITRKVTPPDNKNSTETPTTPERRRRWQLRSDTNSSMGSSRKWKSMFDVSGRSASPVKSDSTPASPTRRARALTPVSIKTGGLSLARRTCSPSPSRSGLEAKPRTRRCWRRSALPLPKLPFSALHQRAILSNPLSTSCLTWPPGDQWDNEEGDWETMSVASEGSDRAPATNSSSRVVRSQSRSESDTPSSDNTNTQANSSLNLSQVGDSSGRNAQRPASYQLATQSSKAKDRKTGGKEPGSSRRSLGRKGRLSMGLKKQFKSTPDLSLPERDDEEDLKLSPSKTAEDLDLIQTDGKEVYRHMSATKEKDPQIETARLSQSLNEGAVGSRLETGVVSPVPSASSGYVSTTSNSFHNTRSRDSGTGASTPGASYSKTDNLTMPPPLSTVVPSSKRPSKKSESSRRSTMPDLTLEQAKEILTGKSSGSSRRSSHPANTSSGRQRPSSTLSGPVSYDPPPVSNDNMPVNNQQTHEEPSLQSCTHSVNRATNAKESSFSSTNMRVSAAYRPSSLPFNRNDLDASPNDLPEKDNYTASGSSYQPSHGPSFNQNSSVQSQGTASSAVPTHQVSRNQHLGTADPCSPESDKRNVTFVVDKKANGLDAGHVLKTPANACLKRLGKPFSPIIGGEPDVDGQENGHASSDTDLFRQGERPQSQHVNNTTVTLEKPLAPPGASTRLDKPQGPPGSSAHPEKPLVPPGSSTHLDKPLEPPGSSTQNQTQTGSILGHLRRRDPHAHNRISPTRHLNSNVTVATSGPPPPSMPPAMPPPLTPPRDINTNSGSPIVSPRSDSGHLSPTKSVTTLNREAMTARWQRAQQNREQRSGRRAASAPHHQAPQPVHGMQYGSDSSHAAQSSSSESESADNLLPPNMIKKTETAEPPSIFSPRDSDSSDTPVSYKNQAEIPQPSVRLKPGHPDYTNAPSIFSRHRGENEACDPLNRETQSQSSVSIQASSAESDMTSDLRLPPPSASQVVSSDPKPSVTGGSDVAQGAQGVQDTTEEEGEIARPDKSHTSPPASLTTSLATTQQSVVIAPPSTHEDQSESRSSAAELHDIFDRLTRFLHEHEDELETEQLQQVIEPNMSVINNILRKSQNKLDDSVRVLPTKTEHSAELQGKISHLLKDYSEQLLNLVAEEKSEKQPNSSHS